MDKLKPILAQKFWILSALCLLLPLTGWWLATGAMAVEITTRTKTLDDAFKGIPQPGANKKWTERVDAMNKEEEVKVKQTGDFLWNQQQELMTWPEVVKAGVEKGGFRGEIDAKTRSEYRTAYEVELVELHQVVKPFDPLTGAGLVEFPIELIPTQSWGSSAIPPSSQQMWDSQEDIWMFRTLLLGVANINEGFKSETVLDSKIKQINLIELRGGIPGGAKAVADAAGGGAGGAAGGAGAEEGRPGMAGGAGGPGLGGLGGGVSGGADTLTHTFDPAEQFGSDAGAVEGAEAGAGPAGAGGAGPAGGPDDALKRGGMMAGGESAVKKRYIEEMPRFKTRGFYMELVLDHRILPEFIAELSDSKWPLRVIRVQAVDCNLDDIAADAAIGGGSGGAGKGRAMGGGSMGRSATPRPTSTRETKLGSGAGGRGSRPGVGVGRAAVGDGTSPENLVDLQSAMADPYLVNVALSGIITLYLPPEAAAGAAPGTEGTPATTPAAGDPTAATTPPAAAPGATDPAAATPVAGAPVGAAVAPPGGDAAAKPGTAATPPAGTPAAETKPATGAKPAADTKPAAETKSAAETKRAADPKPEAKPAAEAKPPADGKPTVPPPATPDPAAKPPATPPAGAANPAPAATPPAKPEAPAPAAKP